MILAGDVGGTNCRLLACTTDGKTVAQKVYPSRAYTHFSDVVADFVQSVGGRFAAACFGLPGPIVEGVCRVTNLPWVVDAAELAASQGIAQVVLLNDLQAHAYGIEELGPDAMEPLQAGKPVVGGPKVVLAPGTGLGEAGIIYVRGEPVAVATEGGHVDLGATSELELELVRYLWRHHGAATPELVLSGPGLINLHDFLRERAGQPPPAWLEERALALGGDRAAAISEAALQGRDPVAEAALELFVSLLAAEAANMSLKYLALGGVYLAGGIPPRILPLLRGPLFLGRFARKDNMSWLLPRIPIHVVLNDQTALLGTVACARRLLHAGPAAVSASGTA